MNLTSKSNFFLTILWVVLVHWLFFGHEIHAQNLAGPGPKLDKVSALRNWAGNQSCSFRVRHFWFGEESVGFPFIYLGLHPKLVLDSAAYHFPCIVLINSDTEIKKQTKPLYLDTLVLVLPRALDRALPSAGLPPFFCFSCTQIEVAEPYIPLSDEFRETEGVPGDFRVKARERWSCSLNSKSSDSLALGLGPPQVIVNLQESKHEDTFYQISFLNSFPWLVDYFYRNNPEDSTNKPENIHLIVSELFDY